MSELLIPFGIHRETGDIIEPEDAPKGRACNCLCPGCKAPLLARHPKEKRFHFAHDSRHKDAGAEEECPFSSAVAVAMMVREIAPALVGKVLHTPAYSRILRFDCCLKKAAKVKISKLAQVVIGAAERSVHVHSHHFDVRFVVAGYPIYIDLTYKGKPAMVLQEAALLEEKSGVLELDCDSFLASWARDDKSQRFSEAVTAFVLDWGKRRWRFHPRQIEKIRAVKAAHHCRFGDSPDPLRVTSPLSDLRGNRRIQPGSSPKFSASKPKPQQERKPKPQQERKPKPQPKSKRYFCVMCEQEWTHFSDHQLSCPRCHTHIYAREV